MGASADNGLLPGIGLRAQVLGSLWLGVTERDEESRLRVDARDGVCHGERAMPRHVEPTTPEDVEVQEVITAVLARFAALRSTLPESFPADRQYGITVDRMRSFSDGRTDRFWHHVNFALALHEYGCSPEPFVRDLLGSLLTALDKFCARFGQYNGARSLLSPLWKNMWTDTPELWSIAACVHMALAYAEDGLRVVGFEQKIGSGPRDADIAVQLTHCVTYVDVEVFHASKFGTRADPEIRAELERRAHEKAAAKFRDLPQGEAGIIAIVSVVSIADIDRRFERPGAPIAVDNMPGVFWMPLRLVGVRDPDLRFVVAGM